MTKRRSAQILHARRQSYSPCPRCGGVGYARVRKGGRTYVAAARDLMRMGSRGWRRIDPRSERPAPLRVYWGDRIDGYRGNRYTLCPVCRNNRTLSWKRAKPAELTTMVNLHEQNLTPRRKSRARLHRYHQSKARR